VGNVFLALGFSPHEAAVTLMRRELAEGLRRWMARRKLTQAQAADYLGMSQPRISEISRNKVDNPVKFRRPDSSESRRGHHTFCPVRPFAQEDGLFLRSNQSSWQ
jgi:predicted XRE-type DNA-binding protein